MDASAYHLQARAPFHFGRRGVGIEATTVYGPSDTLFSALCHAMIQQFGQATMHEFAAGYDSGEPPLVISSAFPYVLARYEEEVDGWEPPDPFDASQAIRFFPRPLEPPPGVPDEPENRKRLKKIVWLSETVFRAWVGGKSLAPLYHQDHLVQGGQVWLSKPELERVGGWRDEEFDAIRLWATGDVPRVTVDRRTNASAVYQAGRVWFPRGGGLWVLARWRKDWQERGDLALRVLGDAGVGGERSAGHGQFCPHGLHTLDGLPDPAPGERFLTLSLYYPTAQELAEVVKGDGVNYRLRVRRGWMSSLYRGQSSTGQPLSGSALRRKAVRMFAQGSILRWPSGQASGDKAALGALADVKPKVFCAHAVQRYGLAYAVGYRTGGGAS